MNPRLVLGEALEEQACRDGAAAAGAVLHVGHGAVHQLVVLQVAGQQPVPLAHRLGGGQQLGEEALVAGHGAGAAAAEHGAHSAGQRGNVHQMGGFGLPDGIGQSVGQNQTALGVGVAHLDGLAREAGNDVARDHAAVGETVFTGGDHGGDIGADAVLSQGQQGAGHGGGPGHVALGAQQARGGLEAVAAGVHGDALAYQAQAAAVLRRAGVGEGDEPGTVDAAVSYSQQGARAQFLQGGGVQHRDLHRQPGKGVGEPPGQQIRRQMVARLVDQVPGQQHGPDQVPGSVQRPVKGFVPAGQRQHHRDFRSVLGVGLVLVEAIGRAGEAHQQQIGQPIPQLGRRAVQLQAAAGQREVGGGLGRLGEDLHPGDGIQGLGPVQTDFQPAGPIRRHREIGPAGSVCNGHCVVCMGNELHSNNLLR